MTSMFETAKRVQQLPPYPFAELDRKKAELRAKGKDLIDLSIGDPDLPTPAPIVEVMQKALPKKEHHKYPPYSGTLFFKQAIAQWYKNRFDVDLDPATEVLVLIGSKEGIANIHHAFVNPGDVVLIPDPGYPVYTTATLIAGGTPHFLPLEKKNRFLPDLDAIPAATAQKAKLLHFNYPNNPTAALADETFNKKVVAFAKKK